jgi:hypothetical protein
MNKVHPGTVHIQFGTKDTVIFYNPVSYTPTRKIISRLRELKVDLHRIAAPDLPSEHTFLAKKDRAKLQLHHDIGRKAMLI